MGTTIFDGIKASDIDAGVNGAVEYFIVEGDVTQMDNFNDTLSIADGYGTFAISYPHQGHVSRLIMVNRRDSTSHLYFLIL